MRTVHRHECCRLRGSTPNTATSPATSLAHTKQPVRAQSCRAACEGQRQYNAPGASSLAAAKKHSHVRHSTRVGRRQQIKASAIPETATGITAVGQTSFAWSSYVSRRINLDLAVDEAVAGAMKHKEQHWGPELAIVFLSSAYVAEYGQLIQQLRNKIPSLKYIIGSTGYGVIGSTVDGPEEIEHAPSLSLTLASLPGVHVSTRHVTQEQLPDGDAPPEQWASLLGVQLDSEAADTHFIMLADPEFGKLMELTAGLDFAFPAANKIGGLVSAGKLSPARAMFAWSQTEEDQQQQQQQLPADSSQQQPEQPQQQQTQEQQEQRQWQPSMLRTGAVVMSLQGPVQMELLVAQGCRPLSDAVYTLDKTASHSSVVLRLRDAAGRALTPVEALQKELQKVAKNRTELLQLLQNMALGLVPDVLRAADATQLEPQDFLIRGMALDKSGFMVVGDSVRVGQQIRFMVRDRQGAQQDLTSHCLAYKRRELAASMSGQPQAQAFGMLLFSCNGRGMNLYDEPSYDSRTLASYIPVPCGGFMCNGEIGTIGGATHLHGFTCAAAVLRAAPGASAGGVTEQ